MCILDHAVSKIVFPNSLDSLPHEWPPWFSSQLIVGWLEAMEKEMATHSSILAREILQTEEPGTLQSMGLQKRGTWLND